MTSSTSARLQGPIHKNSHFGNRPLYRAHRLEAPVPGSEVLRGGHGEAVPTLHIIRTERVMWSEKGDGAVS